MVALHVCQVWWTLAYKPLRTRRHKSSRTLCQGRTVRACVHSVGMLCGYMPNSSLYCFSRQPSVLSQLLQVLQFKTRSWSPTALRDACHAVCDLQVCIINHELPWPPPSTPDGKVVLRLLSYLLLMQNGMGAVVVPVRTYVLAKPRLSNGSVTMQRRS